MSILIGDEVENPEGTISGIVYKIDEDGLYHFVDEHYSHYRMRQVRKCSYLSYHEIIDIMENLPRFFGRNFRNTFWMRYQK